MNRDVESLLAAWRADAARLRTWGSVETATILERCADQLDDAIAEWGDRTLTLAEASAECGYSQAQLRRLLRQGTLRDEGSDGRVRVRRGALPWKAARLRNPLPLGLLSSI